MAIIKGHLITAQDNVDRAENQPFAIKVSQHITGGFFTGTTENWDVNFWTRGLPSEFNYPLWAVGTTYAEGEKVRNGLSAWRSKDDGNIGNSPDTDFWDKLWTQKLYPNEKVYSSDLGDNSLNGNFQRWTNGSTVYNRDSEALFSYTTYDVGITYAFKAIVFDATKDAYYVSAVPGNLGNDLDDEAYWFLLIQNNDSPAWHNFEFSSSAYSFDNNVWNVFLERIIWDGTGDPHYIPVYSLSKVNSTKNGTDNAYFALDPGYYRFRGTHSAAALYGDSIIKGQSRQAVNTMTQEDLINQMKSDFSDNVVGEITASLGTAGRLSHPDFRGGTPPQ